MEAAIRQAQSMARDGSVKEVDRYQEYTLAAMRATNGNLAPNTTDFDIATLGLAGLIRSGVKSALGVVGSAVDRKVVQEAAAAGAKAGEIETVGLFSNLGSNEAIASARAYKEALHSEQTLVLGRLDDTAAGAELGMNRLYEPGWSVNVNDAWIQGGINAGKPFYLGSNISISNLRSGNPLYPTTILFRELKQLRDANYFRQGDWMLPPIK